MKDVIGGAIDKSVRFGFSATTCRSLRQYLATNDETCRDEFLD
jgi:hypothetical protein